ncbi:MAG: response regulator [Alphaproteobacteria bacterium]|nr:response regulator [Alphaproteobacteria bacterium]
MSIKSSLRCANARILIVDDAEFTRRLTSAALAKAGFRRIEFAKDGVEALQKTAELHPDLVILDLSMPRLDGFGYCERVRGDTSLPRMPIIVQTALEDRQSRLRALSCGADDFLTKPLDMDELCLRICVHVERYFMLCDANDMCGYLKMEIEQMQRLRAYMEQGHPASSGTDLLDNHLDVMKVLVECSANNAG